MQTGVIYARYSCEKQTENSILGQVRECNIFAERNNIKVLKIYKDEAISGKTALKRPGFMQMIQDASAGLFNCVIVWKGDRFSRSRVDAAKYKAELKHMGVKVLSATEANVTGAEAVLMDGINEAFAEFYIVELAEKVNRGMVQNALDGKFNGGLINFGYKLDENRKVVIDESRAFIVRELFETYTKSSVSINEMVKIFKRKGYVNQRGKPFRHSTLRQMLKCPKYIGKYIFKDVVNLTMYPRLISDEMFEAAQQKMSENQINRGNFTSENPFLLKDVLYCGYCGEKMTTVSGTSSTGRPYHYYKCKNWMENQHELVSFNKGQIEDVVLRATSNFFYDRNLWNRIIEKYADTVDQNCVNIDEKKKALKETNDSLNALMKAIEKGADVDIFLNRIKELKELRIAQEEEVRQAQPMPRELLIESLKVFFNQVSIMDLMTMDLKKEIVRYFIKRIYVTNTDIQIDFHFDNKMGQSSLYMSIVQNTGIQAHQTGQSLELIYIEDMLVGIQVRIQK